MIDLNEADKQSPPETLIAHGAQVPVEVRLRPGGAGKGGWLKRSKAGTCLMVDLEFTVIEGEYARRKFWTLLTVEGETEGQHKAAGINRARMRAMVESAHGIDPTDDSDTAMAARRVETLEQFDGLRFWAVVGVERGKNGHKDKNVLLAVLTPDRKGWRRLEPPVVRAAIAPTPQSAAAPVRGSRPSWA
jgi:hypothetical protein